MRDAAENHFVHQRRINSGAGEQRIHGDAAEFVRAQRARGRVPALQNGVRTPSTMTRRFFMAAIFGFGPVVNEFLFLQQNADALQPPHFLRVVKQNPVRMNVGVLVAAFAQFAAQLRFVRAVGFLDVEDDFVQFERVVVDLAQFHLPRADVRRVVEDVFQFVEIHERALDFVEVHLLDFRAARNPSDQPRQERWQYGHGS